MDITDETVDAYCASKRLQEVYDAYRASSRAHVLVLRRLERGLDAATAVPDEQRAHDRIGMERRIALAIETEATFTIRREQLRRRLLDLQGLPELG